MNFNDFSGYIPKLTNVSLPGETAHLKMAPPERRELMKKFDLSLAVPKKAAVMMLIYPKNGETNLVLILRNTYKGVHSSQIAFPGGKVETEDESYLFAALRETEEEIGVARSTVKFICPLSSVYIPPSNYMVFPFLGYCESTPHFIAEPREVAGIVELPVKDLLDDGRIIIKKMATSYSESVDVPAFEIGDHAVWGATAMMLSELKEVLKAVI